MVHEELPPCSEKFTEPGRKVIVLAQEQARLLNHNYIGTEHLLLGLNDEGEGLATQALESLGISLDSVRQQDEEILGQGQQPPGATTSALPPSDRLADTSRYG